IALWWTKRSLEPSSGVMKPKPLSSLNHLTVPVAMLCSSTASCALRTREKRQRRQLRALGTASPDHVDPAVTAPTVARRWSTDRVGGLRRGVGAEAHAGAEELGRGALLAVAQLVARQRERHLCAIRSPHRGDGVGHAAASEPPVGQPDVVETSRGTVGQALHLVEIA